jgi:hypothetical protein
MANLVIQRLTLRQIEDWLRRDYRPGPARTGILLLTWRDGSRGPMVVIDPDLDASLDAAEIADPAFGMDAELREIA